MIFKKFLSEVNKKEIKLINNFTKKDIFLKKNTHELKDIFELHPKEESKDLKSPIPTIPLKYSKLYGKTISWESMKNNERKKKRQKTKRKKRRLLALYKRKQKKSPKILPKKYCTIHALCTNNNTIITATNPKGDAFASSTGGKPRRYKNTRRNIRFAAQLAMEEVVKKIIAEGYTFVELKIKGIGNGRRALSKGLAQSPLRVFQIRDITAAPHNGCRPPKPKR